MKKRRKVKTNDPLVGLKKVPKTKDLLKRGLIFDSDYNRNHREERKRD